jgi:hypothetical protein
MSPLLERIYSRCIEDGDCLIWQGAVTESGMPFMAHGGKVKAMVRRVLYVELHGSIPEGRLITPTCGHKRCLAEHHLQALTPKRSKEIAVRKGAYKNPARHRKAVLTMRAKSHITEEIVQAIRNAPTSRAAHEQTGASLPYCYAIRDGVRRADMASPFAGLGSRV